MTLRGEDYGLPAGWTITARMPVLDDGRVLKSAAYFAVGPEVDREQYGSIVFFEPTSLPPGAVPVFPRDFMPGLT